MLVCYITWQIEYRERERQNIQDLMSIAMGLETGTGHLLHLTDSDCGLFYASFEKLQRSTLVASAVRCHN